MNIYELKEQINNAVEDTRMVLQNDACSNAITLGIKGVSDIYACIFIKTITGYKLSTCKKIVDIIKKENVSYSEVCIVLASQDQLV